MRLLTPADFGLLAMALVFTGFANIFSKIGIAQALIQRKDLKEAHRSSAFWVSLVTGALVFIAILAIAPWVADFYNEPRLVPIISVISTIYAIGAVGRVPNALLRRRLDFRSIGISSVLGTVIGGAAAIVMAMTDFGVWSLVAYQWLSGVIDTVLQWLWARWRPTLTFSRWATKDLFSFGVNLSAFQLFNYWTRNADNLLIGRFIGSAALGYYSRAYSLMLLPVTQVTDVVGSVMWSALARIQDEKSRVKRIILRSVGLIGLINFPIVLGLFVVAERFIPLLVGEQWIPAVSTFRILAFVGLLQSVSSVSIWIFQSQGRADLMLRWQIIKGTIAIISFAVGIAIGSIEAVATSYLVVSIGLFYFDLRISGRLIDLSFKDVSTSLRSITLCASVMAVVTWTVGTLLPSLWPSWLILSLQITVGALVYGILIHYLKVEPYLDFRQLLLEQFGRQGRMRKEVSPP